MQGGRKFGAAPHRLYKALRGGMAMLELSPKGDREDRAKTSQKPNHSNLVVRTNLEKCENQMGRR